MNTRQLRRLVEQSRTDEKFFHDLVFRSEPTLKKFLGPGPEADGVGGGIDPAAFLRDLILTAGSCSEGGSTCSCTTGTCGGDTCGGGTCSATCTGDSCGNTCGDSCGYTTNSRLGGRAFVLLR